MAHASCVQAAKHASLAPPCTSEWAWERAKAACVASQHVALRKLVQNGSSGAAAGGLPRREYGANAALDVHAAGGVIAAWV